MANSSLQWKQIHKIEFYADEINKIIFSTSYCRFIQVNMVPFERFRHKAVNCNQTFQNQSYKCCTILLVVMHLIEQNNQQPFDFFSFFDFLLEIEYLLSLPDG